MGERERLLDLLTERLGTALWADTGIEGLKRGLLSQEQAKHLATIALEVLRPELGDKSERWPNG